MTTFFYFEKLERDADPNEEPPEQQEQPVGWKISLEMGNIIIETTHILTVTPDFNLHSLDPSYYEQEWY
jgi:hypothetical protein